MSWLRGLLTPERLLRTGLFLLLASIVASTRTDPDLWGHVRFGLDMIRDRAIVQPDTYSFTSDTPWLNHEWASEIAMGGAFQLAGNAGLSMLKLGVLGGVLLLLSAALRADGVSSARHRDLAAALAVIVTIEQAHNLRPQLFSLWFFSCLLACLVLSRTNRRILFAVPPIFAVWANFHGGWIVGGGVLLLWTAGLLASSGTERRGVLPWIAAGAAALGATLLNPHGIGLWEFLGRTVGLGRADIIEWQPVYAVGGNILALWLLAAVLAAFGAVRGRGASAAAARLPVVLALGIASFRVNRLLAFFGLATLFLYGAVLASALARRSAVTRAPRRAAVYTAVAIALLMIAAAGRLVATQAACVTIDSRTTPEPEAVPFFEQHGSKGRLLVWFDWGEYALWHLAPNLLVSVDGRRETVYSARVQNEHLRFYFDAPGGAGLPRELNADYIWMPKNLPAVRRALDGGWREVYRGEQSIVLARTQLPSLPETEPRVTSGRRCFPGP